MEFCKFVFYNGAQERREKEVIINVIGFVLTVLTAAVVLDYHCWRVPNTFIGLSSITSLYILWSENGVWGCTIFAFHFLLSILLLYIFYLAKGLGAGDVKLLAVVSTTMTIRGMIWVVVVSIAIGACWGLLRYIRQGRFLLKGKEYLALGRSCFYQKSGSILFQKLQQGEKIHFTLCILLAYVGWICKEGVM